MNKTISSFFWQSIDRFSVQGVQFLIGIIISRILTPNDYGIIGIIMVFFVFCDIFVNSGFSVGLINKTNRTDVDSSTVFLFNIFVSIICVIFLWIFSPAISLYYDKPDLSILLRVSSITLIFNALSTVQISHLIISLSFKKLAKANFYSTLLSGGVAVILAYNNWGVWALIYQYLVRSVILFLIIWISTSWRPLFIFSKRSFKELYSYGSNVFLASCIMQLSSSLNNIFIAKQLSISSLGYYTRGQQFPTFIQGALASIFSNVSLPILSETKKNELVFAVKARLFIKMGTIVTLPIMLLLAILSKPLVIILLTDKWLPCVPIIQLYCFVKLLQNSGTINSSCTLAKGHSNVTVIVELIKFPFGVIVLFVGLKHGLYYLVLLQCVSSIVFLFIDSYYIGKVINYNMMAQIKDVLPFILSGGIAGLISCSFYLFVDQSFMQILVVLSTFICTYIACLYFLKNPELYLVITHIRNIEKK